MYRNWEVQGFGYPIYVNATYEFTSPGHKPFWDRPIRLWYPKNLILQEPIAANLSFPIMDGKRNHTSADAAKGAAITTSTAPLLNE